VKSQENSKNKIEF